MNARAHRPHPLLSALLGLWLLFATVQPVTWHPCPMHDGVAASAAGGMGAMGAMGAMGSMASMAGMTDDDHGGAPVSGHHGAHSCTCLDTGCCGPTAALPSPCDVGHWGVAVTDVRREVLAPVAPEPAAADHVIPFANGPPASRAV